VGAPPPRGGLVLLDFCEARVVCAMDIFTFGEIWTQDEIYILVGTLLG
jgi:hypothetical protein